MPHRPWSFSSLTLYESCPYKYKLKYIDKQPEPPKGENDPTVRGNRVHEGIEQFLRGQTDLPTEAASLDTAYHLLRDCTLTMEEEWGFDRDWNVLPSWDHPDISCKMKLDVFYISNDEGNVIDHKTGKRNDLKHAQQGQLYAIGAMHRHPELTAFNVGFWYVDQGETKTVQYAPSAVAKFQQSYERRLERFWNDEQFKPISHKFNCKWCPYGSNGTAICDYRSE